MFIFNRKFEEDKDRILSKSPCPFTIKMLFVKCWSPQMNLENEEIKTVPIWIRLSNLKLHYYMEVSLIKFASYIGVFLYTDQQTTSSGRLSYMCRGENS